MTDQRVRDAPAPAAIAHDGPDRARPWPGVARLARRRGVSGLRGWVGRRGVPMPALALVLATAVVYHVSLASLLEPGRFDTPLAYVVLIPALCLAMAAFIASRYRGLPQPERDRYSDVFFGVPLLVAAVALVTLVPVTMSSYYGLDRPDLLSLGCFVSAAVILLYGTAWAWRLRVVVLFQLLAWPAIYGHLLSGVVQRLADGIGSGLAVSFRNAGVLGVALVPPDAAVHSALGVTPLRLTATLALTQTAMAVGVVVAAAAALTRGGWLRKLSWLVAAMTICATLCAVRLLLVVLAARVGGTGLAMLTEQAVPVLPLFVVATVLTLLVAGPFGLYLRTSWLSPREALALTAPSDVTTGSPRAGEARGRPSRRWPSAVAAGVVLVLLLVGDRQATALLSLVDGGGNARVRAFSAASLPAGWRSDAPVDYPWARNYFGAGSSVVHYHVTTAPGLHADVEIVSVAARTGREDCGPSSCFAIHGDSTVAAQRVDLGRGLTGTAFELVDPSSRARVSEVAWTWPVARAGRTGYERVTLAMPLMAAGQPPAALPANTGLARGLEIAIVNAVSAVPGDGSERAPYAATDATVLALAQQLVAAAVERGESDGFPVLVR